jgi:hypothetical protein
VLLKSHGAAQILGIEPRSAEERKEKSYSVLRVLPNFAVKTSGQGTFGTPWFYRVSLTEIILQVEMGRFEMDGIAQENKPP